MSLISFPLKCVFCRIEQAGVDSHDVCPGCGIPVSETLLRIGVDPETLEVVADVACLGCGYNLRTIPATGVCPECAAPVASSLRGDDLRRADPGWMRSVRSGTTILIWSVFLMVGSSIALPLLMVAAMGAGAFIGATGVAQIVLYLALWVLLCVGVFKATATDSFAGGRHHSGFYGKLARVCCLLPIPLWIASSILTRNAAAWVSGGMSPTMLRYLTFSMVSGAVTMVLMAAGAVGLFVCVRRVFVRARRDGARKLTSAVIGIVGVCVPLVGVAQAMMVYASRSFLSAAALSATTAPAAPLPGARVSSPAPGIRVEDYSTPASGSPGDSSGTGVASAPAAKATSPVVITTSATALTITPPTPVAMVTMAVAGIAGCAGGALTLAACVMGIVALFKCRNLLTDALAIRGSTT